MEEKVCRKCLGACSSTEEKVEILHGESSVCVDCPRQPIIQAVSEQFRSQRARWWQVNGEIVVPVWIVEHVKRR